MWRCSSIYIGNVTGFLNQDNEWLRVSIEINKSAYGFTAAFLRQFFSPIVYLNLYLLITGIWSNCNYQLF